MPLAEAKSPPINATSIGLIIEQQRKEMATPQVNLQFSLSPKGISYLSLQLAKYPFHVGRLLKNSSTPEEMAMLFLQSTSGGLFEHDRIGLKITAKTKAVASVKHAAATVVHSMQQGQAISRLNIVAEVGSYLEYTGNLNILFPKSNLVNQIDVELHPNAITLISDAYLVHDPEQQANYFEQLDTTINVYNHHHQLLVKDRFLLSGVQLASQLQAVDKKFDTHASLYLLTPNCTTEENAVLLKIINESITNAELSKKEAYFGSGILPNQCGVFVRLMTRSGQSIQKTKQ